MARNGIKSRDKLAEVLEVTGIGRATIYRTFDTAWSGKVSPTVLAQVTRKFNLLGIVEDAVVRLVDHAVSGEKKS